MSIPLIWGDIGMKKCLFSNAQKIGLWAAKSKNRDHFLTPTSPQNDGIRVCFVRLSLLGVFLANFEIWLILSLFSFEQWTKTKSGDGLK